MIFLHARVNWRHVARRNAASTRMPTSPSNAERQPTAGTGHNNPLGAIDQLSVIEQNRIVLLPEAARLAGVSIDTLRRYHSDKFIRLSKQRQGMRLRDALMMKTA